MVTVYYWPTSNGHKILIVLEETETPYTLKPVNIGEGAQFSEDFQKISPNGKIPAIVDDAPQDGGSPLSLFESGAILEYLADKAGRFLPDQPRARHSVRQWMFWQAASVGPMLGQYRYFSSFAPERLLGAIGRYQRETARLYGVLNQQLEGRKYIVDTCSIADIACYPWIVQHDLYDIQISDFANVQRWLETMRARRGVRKAYEIAGSMTTGKSLSKEAQRILFAEPSGVL